MYLSVWDIISMASTIEIFFFFVGRIDTQVSPQLFDEELEDMIKSEH